MMSSQITVTFYQNTWNSMISHFRIVLACQWGQPQTHTLPQNHTCMPVGPTPNTHIASESYLHASGVNPKHTHCLRIVLACQWGQPQTHTLPMFFISFFTLIQNIFMLLAPEIFLTLTSYISFRRGPNTEKCDVMRNVTIHQSQHSYQG
jgi:hypothetical protein